MASAPPAGGGGFGGFMEGIGGVAPWGAAAKLAGDLIGGHKQRKAATKEMERVQGLYDKDYEIQQAYADQIGAAFGEGGQYAGAIGADSNYNDQENTSRSGSSTENTQQRAVANAEDAGMTGVLRQQLENGLTGPTGTEALPGQYARNAGREKTALGAALDDRAAGLGRTNSEIDKITAGRDIEANYLGNMANLPLLNEQIRAGRRGESSDFLRARLGSDTNSKRRFSEVGSRVASGRRSGDTVGDALRVYGAARPVDRQVATRGA